MLSLLTSLNFNLYLLLRVFLNLHFLFLINSTSSLKSVKVKQSFQISNLIDDQQVFIKWWSS